MQTDPTEGLSADLPATPMLTADLPGVGGRIKDRPEDFRVVERPAYEPCGEGDHLYLWVEKRDLSHERLLDHVGRSLKVARRDVGTSGMKDRRAVTRQWVSVPARVEDRVGELDNELVRVLKTDRHGNSLKPGHLRGNDFEIIIRGVSGDALSAAQAVLDRVAAVGCPNYFGPQRFGIDGSTLAIGEQLVSGDLKQKAIPHARRRFLVRLGLSAVQSAVFNDVLAARLRDGLLSTVLEGDVMSFPGSRTVFIAQDLAVEQPRLNSGETVLTGPMVGVRMKGPAEPAAERERMALRARGLRTGQFEPWKGVAPGTRRPLSVRPQEVSVEAVEDGGGPGLKLSMSLPAGAYATVVLNELMKVGVGDEPEA